MKLDFGRGVVVSYADAYGSTRWSATVAVVAGASVSVVVLVSVELLVLVIRPLHLVD